MGNDAKRWHTKKAGDDTGDVGILNQDGKLIAEVFAQVGRKAVPVDAAARAAHIVRAHNAHDALVAVCEEAVHLISKEPGCIALHDKMCAAIALTTEAADAD